MKALNEFFRKRFQVAKVYISMLLLRDLAHVSIRIFA